MPRIARLLRDNALGLIAITIALSAGAYAVDKAPKNSVVSSSIRTGSVKSVDVKDDSLTGKDINESTLALPSDAGGTVKSVTAGSGLDGGTITDSGTISFKTCPASQILKSTGAAYACASDADTTYTGNSAAGVELTGNAFALKPCAGGQVLKSAGAGAWACAADTDTNTTYTGNSAAGVELTGNAFALKPCAGGQVLKSAGAGAWACAADSDTTYSAGTGLQLAGGVFSIPNGGVGSAEIADDSITAADLGFVRAANFAGGPLANGQCSSAVISQTAQFAPGAPGDYTLVTSDPAMPLRFVLSGQVGPINAGFREYYLSVCNLSGSTANVPAAAVRMLVISQ